MTSIDLVRQVEEAADEAIEVFCFLFCLFRVFFFFSLALEEGLGNRTLRLTRCSYVRERYG